MRIYVGNIAWAVNDSDLNCLFSQYGKVKSAVVLKDKVTGKSRGYGFVEMENDDIATKVIAKLDGHEWLSRRIVVNSKKSLSLAAKP